ncbi:hypothetical protein FGO68_gene2608 [Halteria grandinella]|uniref:Cyclin-dependent kinase 2 homolog n=1 Tax=Halteria grandinella TaxID=5974 RepID=A0A8J8T0Z7_HALGN|nr:hypothetical protein FGO68_gene2608 [Halteria grandinella]
MIGKRTQRPDSDHSQSEDEQPPQPIPQIPQIISKRPRVALAEGCRSIESFEHLNKIDEGAYGVVFRARDRETGEIVAIKKLKLEKEKEGFPITALRELSTLIGLRHPNIINVKEVVYGSSLDKIYVVMEYLDHELKSILEDRKIGFTHSEVKTLVFQLLSGLAHMHARFTFHRDIKTSNLLYSNEGTLKLCDFGLARKFAHPLRPYTNLVVTLWYRAPELLFGADVYSEAVDLWSVGCVMGELILREPLLMGKGEMDQIDKIVRVMGNPTEQVWPGWSKLRYAKNVALNKKFNQNRLREKFPVMPLSPDDHMYLSDLGLDLLQKLLTYDPAKRISASDALRHPWFKEAPTPAKDMPQFPSLNEMSREQLRTKRKKSMDEEQRRQRDEMHDKEDRYLMASAKKSYQGV